MVTMMTMSLPDSDDEVTLIVMSSLSLVSTHWASHSAPARLSPGGATYRWPGPAASCRHGVTPWTNQRPGNWRRALIGRESDGARGRLVMVRLASASHFSRGIIKTRKPEKTDWRVQRPGHHYQSVWPLGDITDRKWWHHVKRHHWPECDKQELI